MRTELRETLRVLTVISQVGSGRSGWGSAGLPSVLSPFEAIVFGTIKELIGDRIIDGGPTPLRVLSVALDLGLEHVINSVG